MNGKRLGKEAKDFMDLTSDYGNVRSPGNMGMMFLGASIESGLQSLSGAISELAKAIERRVEPTERKVIKYEHPERVINLALEEQERIGGTIFTSKTDINHTHDRYKSKQLADARDEASRLKDYTLLEQRCKENDRDIEA